MLTAAAVLTRAIAIALLFRIAWTDFETQKISNIHVLVLGALGLGGLAVTALTAGSWASLLIALAASALLFCLLFPFWLLRKIGAGDVKLIAVAPMVAGGDYLFPFALLLLLFAILTVVLVKNPIFLPAPAFRKYLDVFDRKGVVPFGVPIAASLVGVLILQASNVGQFLF